jgi:hypothetical protein
MLTDTHVSAEKAGNWFSRFFHTRTAPFLLPREIRLNRRLCPTYEEVMALRETDSGAAFVGDGEVIDYAVMMKRLPANRMFDRLVDRGAVSVDEIQLIALESVYSTQKPLLRHAYQNSDLRNRFNLTGKKILSKPYNSAV